MMRLIRTPFYHFFDDRTDAAALDALIRGRFTLVNRKTTARARPDDKPLKSLKDL